MMNFVTRAKAIADVIYPDATTFNGDLGDDGSVAGGSPQVTFCDGDCQFGGNGHGAGLLIVTGRLDWNARRKFRGLILVVGDGELNIAGNGGGGKGILGGLFVSKITGAPGSYTFADPLVTIGGQMHFYFQGSGVRMAYSLLPYRLLGWREVTPELEP